MDESARRGAGRRRAAGDEQDGVVTGDGAGDLGQAGAVQRRPEQVGAAGRGAQDDEAAGRLGADAELLEQPPQRGPGLRVVPPSGWPSGGRA